MISFMLDKIELRFFLPIFIFIFINFLFLFTFWKVFLFLSVSELSSVLRQSFPQRLPHRPDRARPASSSRRSQLRPRIRPILPRHLLILLRGLVHGHLQSFLFYTHGDEQRTQRRHHGEPSSSPVHGRLPRHADLVLGGGQLRRQPRVSPLGFRVGLLITHEKIGAQKNAKKKSA